MTCKKSFLTFSRMNLYLTEKEILAYSRMKSANADEIFSFASDRIKSTSAIEQGFIQRSWISSSKTISPTNKGGFS